MRGNGKLDYLPCPLEAVKWLHIWALLQSGKSTWKSKYILKSWCYIDWTKKEYNVLLISVHVSPILSQLYDIFLNLGLFLFFFILEKMSWKEKTGGKKRFHSVIQRHHVNASILFLTTSINCRSYSPTRSTFLLEREAELLRLKWDEECSKRCCSCPLLTPSPPVFFFFPSSDANPNLLAFIHTGARKHQTPKHLKSTDDLCRWETRS